MADAAGASFGARKNIEVEDRYDHDPGGFISVLRELNERQRSFYLKLTQCSLCNNVLDLSIQNGLLHLTEELACHHCHILVSVKSYLKQ